MSGELTTASCHHRTYEEETSENEAVAEEEEEREEEEGEEDVFAEKVSPEAEEYPALKVKKNWSGEIIFHHSVWVVRKGSQRQGEPSKWTVCPEVAVPALRVVFGDTVHQKGLMGLYLSSAL